MNNEQISSCLLCGGDAVLKHNGLPGYQAPEFFKIYECLNCNTSFSLPRVEAIAVYENIYKNGRNVPGYDRYWKYMEAVKKSSKPLEYLAGVENIYWSVNEALISLVKEKKSIKILEIGSGLGYLTYSLNAAGYNVVGLDISQTAVTQAIEIFGNHYVCTDLFEYSQLHPESYDIVVLSEVIEHIDKPLDFIASIFRLLKQGGSAIITTPNKSLFPSDIIWKTENPPVHGWWFSEDSMKFIANKNLVKLEFVDFSKFYKNNYTSFDLKKTRTASPLPPTFNEAGDLLVSIKQKDSLFGYMRSVLSKLPPLKRSVVKIRNYFFRLREASNPDIIICGERGTVLCAIFEKK